jgi:hypothetical protein
MNKAKVVELSKAAQEKFTEKFVGMQKNNLTIVEVVGKRQKNNHILAKALCVCGKYIVTAIHDIIRGHTKSCGCIKKLTNNASGTVIHGETRGGNRTAEYRTWIHMRSVALCKSEASKIKFKVIRSKGVSMCNEWLDKEKGFFNFLEDMGRKPTKHHRIKRIDDSKGFSKENCVWGIGRIHKSRLDAGLEDVN